MTGCFSYSIISSIIHPSKFQKMIDENEVLHSIPLPLSWGGVYFSPPLQRKEGQTMELLTHIIFVLNLLKTLLNHFF